MTFVRDPRLQSLMSPAAIADRVAMLTMPHVRPLEIYREALLDRGPTPHFDPLDGGVKARILLLLETPGPGLAPIRFTSVDNPSLTAANLRRFTAAAGLAREAWVLWNTAPWIRSPERVRASATADVSAGLARLPKLLELLPRLRVVVLAGRKAASAAPVVAEHAPALQTLIVPHPSPTYINTRADLAPRFVDMLSQAREFAGR